MSGAEDFEPVHLPTPVVEVRRWNWGLVPAAMMAGALSASAAALVRMGFRGLQWLLTGSGADPPIAATALPEVRRFATPVVGAFLAVLVLWVRRRLAHGRKLDPYVEYVEAVRHREGALLLAPNLWRTLSAAFSVASGASVGREGSMIQLAATIASVCGRWFSQLLRVPPCFLGLLVACGVAGGVTAAYNAPVAAVFFAAEIVLGGIEMLELSLLALAASAGWVISGSILGWERLYPTSVDFRSGWALSLLPLFAIVLGLAGPAYQWLLGSLAGVRRFPLAIVCGAAVVGFLSLLDVRVWGNGDVGLRTALHSADALGGVPAEGAVGGILLLRLCATLACVWTGTVGGVFTPTLFAGGAVGALLVHVIPGEPSALWVIAGMSFLMAAVTHAPLMAAFIAVELTGDWKLLWLLLPLNYVSWTIARRISPRAMYAIASQFPEHEGAMSPPPTKTVQ